jgi:hypothetical protein
VSDCGVARDETPCYELQWRTGHLKEITSPLNVSKCFKPSVCVLPHCISHERRVRGEADKTKKNILLCQDMHIPSCKDIYFPSPFYKHKD